MGRTPCCDKASVKKGPWSPEEDAKLKEYIEKCGIGCNWIALPQKAGLRRCGKSCRLRWLNYLRPNIKHGDFSDEEDRIICSLFASIGSRWSIIAAQLPGRTDNDIKNYWNTKLKKKLMGTANPPDHKKAHHASPAYQPTLTQTHSSISSMQSTPSSTSPFHFNPGTYWNTPSTVSLTGLTNLVSLLSNPSKASSSYQVPPTTQDGHRGSMQSYLMFGGGEPSCSSSYGSGSNQIMNGKDIDHEYASGEKQDIMQKHFYFYQGHDGNQEMMLPNGESQITLPVKPNPEEVGFWTDTGLEREIKENWTAEVPIDYDIDFELEIMRDLLCSTQMTCSNHYNCFC